MSARLRMILREPLASASRTASRRVTLPSPRVMRPLRSRMVTPSTCRVATFMLIAMFLLKWLSRRLRRGAVFDQRQFCAWIQLAKVYLIHEGADKEDAPSRSAQDVFGREGVRERVGI